MTGRVWRLELPYARPPLTLNPDRHGHYMARAAQVRRVRLVGANAARGAGVPQLLRIALELHYRPRDRRRRDPRNLAPTLKALEDGLVDAGVVPDDTPEHVDGSRQELYVDPPNGDPGLFLVVRERAPLCPSCACPLDEHIADPVPAWCGCADHGDPA